ncbi:MAG: thioesterase domain-containing protein [Candidatus Competibacteraceae bacterium]
MGQLLGRGIAHASVLRMDWRKRQTRSQLFSRLASESLTSETQGGERGHVRAAIMEAPQSERAVKVYQYLLQQVARILGISPARLDPKRPWNELGLDSLMAVELENQVENDLDIALPMNELAQHRTVEKLTQRVLSQLGIEAETGLFEGAATTPEETTGLLVALRVEGDQPAIFCAHAADGRTEIYTAFGKAMPAGLPVYALRSALLSVDQRPWTLPELAAHYADSIRRQAEPPYRLFGFSFGSLMAMMIAGELQKQAPVDFVGLVDFNPDWTDPQCAKRDLLRDIITGLYEQIATQLNLPERLPAAAIEAQLTGSLEELLTADAERRVDKITDWVRAEKLLPESVSLEPIRQYVKIFERHLDLIEGSVLPVLDAPLHIWQAARGPAADVDLANRWRFFTKRTPVGHVLDCGHWEIIAHPQVDVIASQVAAILYPGS